MDAPPLHLQPGAPSWPKALDRIEVAPSDLWLRGRAELLRIEPKIAIVGSRSPSPYGEAQARRFAEAFAREGFVIVSGLARGIDQAAHRGALDAKGATVAVLGSGVDCPWPRGEVADRLATHGLLLSEYAPGTGPRRHHFPLRNRLIAGLSTAVLVVEAAWASGSLITARWAVDQGKAVFALPGRVDHPLSRGTLRLIREGATPVLSPTELLQDLFGGEQVLDDPETQTPRDPILGVLRGETLTADEVAQRLNRPIADVLGKLALHELDGRVARSPGGLYRLA